MTTVTITIDDPNGLDSNLLFPSAFPTRVYAASSSPTTGGVGFSRYIGGVEETSVSYQLYAGGNSFVISPVGIPTADVSGFVNSFQLVRTPSGGSGTQIMHADIALDGDWVTFGGVYIPSFASLTPDVLMGRILQRTAANLVVVGNVGNDTLNGSFLDDTLRGGAGADMLIGGLGNDTASYEGSNVGVTVNLATGVGSGGHAAGDVLSSIEYLLGSSFEDTLTGDAAANFLDGGLGFDVIDGGGGNDFIFGRDGGGLLRGDAGNDRIDGGVQNDTIYGGTGNDELRVGDGDNFGYGEDGDDVLLGAAGIDQLFGGSGSDTLIGLTAADVLDGGAGADSMWGGVGNDTYFVDDAGDVVAEFAGEGTTDRVAARASYTLSATADIELLTTSASTGTAAINLTGNALKQEIIGNAGANTLADGAGAGDLLRGLGGNDVYIVRSAATTIVESSAQGAADRASCAVDYTLGAGVHVEQLTTTSSSGTSGVDLTGNEVAQSITGNAGNNRLEGKGGNDTLRGLAGDDTFVFATALGAGNVDTVLDFNVADDRFLLSDAIFTALTPGTLVSAAFRANTTGLAGDASDRIIYETDTGSLFYDFDGTGAGASVQFATISLGLALTNADFSVA